MTATPTPASASREKASDLDAFATTHWTRVLAARGNSADAQSALGDLCAAYYRPVVAFLQGCGKTDDQARELAHEFFSRILERQGLDGADPQRGRFRSYLLGALKHFLHALREREQRQKRGGAIEHVPLGVATDTSPGFEVADETGLSPDRAFDRQWAVTVLDRALTELEQDLAREGRGRDFEVLKPWLTGDSAIYSQAEAARRLELSEGAVKVAVHRLRKRFRAAVKQEIASTLNSSADLHDELNHLVVALSGL